MLSLIEVLRIPVFHPGFSVVAPLAQCLLVFPVPEQFPVTAVWFDVVHDRRFRVPSLCHAPHAKRMGGQVLPACFLPCTAVAPAARRPDFFRVERFVFIAVFLSGIHQLRASLMAAWHFWFCRHNSLLSSDANSRANLLQFFSFHANLGIWR